ncbi:tRNA pseudouridine(38-40) synthase TruA [Imperialibacter roseus]|uniref:tRNA pseudouridine synthase A n=1 Tax=Imperialibacter roseus TaxID=1324217 RepID=A0ABZ0IU80_9BACT|nr:tRNA pseudouridine(38-40) synthase TruA [Imperialibacter roseus]WOK08539.1 tRNA pseudouridine(38-40) synthase TruA [Imperialibacter roseus]
MIYFLHIGFDGSNYHGWQWQPRATSVQETIEKALHKIFKAPVTVYGCGRTDSGVHASQYMMHIDIEHNVDFDLKFRLNKNLPEDITVYEVLEMEEGRHSRYDANSRTYDYFIHLYEDPVLHKYSSCYNRLRDLDYESMQKAAAILPFYSDFRPVCKRPDDYKHTHCKVTDARLYVSHDGQRMRFTITADRFLRSMVRLLVAYLLKIGTRKLSFEEFENILKNTIVVPNMILAMPNGLYLSRVEYPYLKITPREDFSSFLKVGLGD